MDILRDVIEAGESILLLGRPGVGKTTILREAARVLADELGKRVIVVDTSNEIAGDGDVPHPGIGRARRMQVPSPDEQHAVMIEAVENHMPQVIVIDEIGTTAEALAARTIAERGVQLIATAHGNTLENLLQNPTLSDLVGGIQAVTLSDEEARRRGTQKTVLERKAPPTFGVLIEIQDKDRLAVHHDVAEVVDRFLRDVPPRPELRTRTEGGGVEIQRAERPERPERGLRERPSASDRGGPRSGRAAAAPWFAAPVAAEGEPTEDEPDGEDRFEAATEPPAKALRGRTVRIFPYAVSREKLERALRKFRVSAYVVDDLDERRHGGDPEGPGAAPAPAAARRPRPRHPFLRGAQQHHRPDGELPRRGLRRRRPAGRRRGGAARGRGGDRRGHRSRGTPSSSRPQNNHLRRLQHQIVERYGLTSESKGEEPYRRVVIYPQGEAASGAGTGLNGGWLAGCILLWSRSAEAADLPRRLDMVETYV